jgi:hypothetical protein
MYQSYETRKLLSPSIEHIDSCDLLVYFLLFFMTLTIVWGAIYI